jgi:hypothetical protein
MESRRPLGAKILPSAKLISMREHLCEVPGRDAGAAYGPAINKLTVFPPAGKYAGGRDGWLEGGGARKEVNRRRASERANGVGGGLTVGWRWAGGGLTAERRSGWSR